MIKELISKQILILMGTFRPNLTIWLDCILKDKYDTTGFSLIGSLSTAKQAFRYCFDIFLPF